MPVIGLLSSAGSKDYAPMIAAFRKSLGEAGFIEGKNVSIEYLWADDQYERLPALAAELVRRQVNVIVAAATPAAVAAKPATKTIPIVFAIGGDPVRTGLVDSLSRPGGNLTGAAHILTGVRGPMLKKACVGETLGATSANAPAKRTSHDPNDAPRICLRHPQTRLLKPSDACYRQGVLR